MGEEGETRLDIRTRGAAVEIVAGIIELAEPSHQPQLLQMIADPAVRRTLRAAAGHMWPFYQDAAVCVLAWALRTVDPDLAATLADELVESLSESVEVPGMEASEAPEGGMVNDGRWLMTGDW